MFAPRTPVLLALLALLTSAAPPASAHRPYPRVLGAVELSCDDSPCEEVDFRGQRWVVGRYDQRYAIALVNRSDVWLEAVVTVDGRNILDGQRPGRLSRGYLLAPRSRVAIEGWRVSHSEVAAFRFTSVGDSYAGRVGTPQDAGAIRVDFYPERAPAVWMPTPEEPWGDAPRTEGAERSPSPARSAKLAPSPDRDDRAGQNLGTQYGEHRWQPVSERDFERADSHPAESITLRYDDRRGLVARGILPPRHRSSDDRWVPPPPGHPDSPRWVTPGED